MAAVRIFNFIAISLLAIVMLAALPSRAASARVPSVHVLATGSLTEVLTKLARLYSSQRETTISMTYDNPDVLFEAIEQGEPGHLVITEDSDMMRQLKQRGLIEVQSLSVLAQDRLVLATRAGGRLDTQFSQNDGFDAIIDAAGDYGLFVVANPNSTALGASAKQVLEARGAWQKLQAYMIQPPTVQQARYQSEQPNRFGIVYGSMVDENPLLVGLVDAPPEDYQPIHYQAAVVASRNMAGARDFLQFIKSDEAKEIFAAHGFLDLAGR